MFGVQHRDGVKSRGLAIVAGPLGKARVCALFLAVEDRKGHNGVER